MADTKLSALPELAAAPDAADELYARDESVDPDQLAFGEVTGEFQKDRLLATAPNW